MQHEINANAAGNIPPAKLMSGGISKARIDGPEGFQLYATVASGDPIQLIPLGVVTTDVVNTEPGHGDSPRPLGTVVEEISETTQIARATTVREGETVLIDGLVDLVTLGAKSVVTFDQAGTDRVAEASAADAA